MSMYEWLKENKEAAKVGPDTYKIQMHEKEYDDLIELFRKIEAGKIGE